MHISLVKLHNLFVHVSYDKYAFCTEYYARVATGQVLIKITYFCPAGTSRNIFVIQNNVSYLTVTRFQTMIFTTNLFRNTASKFHGAKMCSSFDTTQTTRFLRKTIYLTFIYKYSPEKNALK